MDHQENLGEPRYSADVPKTQDNKTRTLSLLQIIILLSNSNYIFLLIVNTMPSIPLQASAVGWLLISVGHTVSRTIILTNK